MAAIWLCNVITVCRSICLLYGISMAATWFSHMDAICIPHSRHLALPYACCMDTTQKEYGKAICLLYGIHTAGILLSHMPAMWHQYSSYIWLNHMAATRITGTTRFKDRTQILTGNMWQNLEHSLLSLPVHNIAWIGDFANLLQK